MNYTVINVTLFVIIDIYGRKIAPKALTTIGAFATISQPYLDPSKRHIIILIVLNEF